ncbi:class II aldolase/adducin family protein [Gordonia desulfuricans]|uniref:Class II aldolase/adducin family protein n=1 Tax=Gordonia desulfuricans TaxID=89051 RepID=A0A7K3LLE1_9ACTN|nr:class II aldolase/adducin family protein [Gordonia desulfuricans]NDK89070.1 class II aldolase/adducin family protein [Gordonia desulfuricans]
MSIAAESSVSPSPVSDSAVPDSAVPDDQPSGIPVRWSSSSLDEERHRRKVALVGGYRLLSRFGMDEGVAGHITARDPELSDHFWTARWGAYFGTVCPEDLILVNADGDIVEGSGPLNGATFAIHAAIHDKRPDVVGAVHAHGLYGKAFSAMGRELGAMTQDACAFYQDHILYPNYDGVVFAAEEGRRIAAALGPRKAAILANHGHLTVGTTVESAVWWFITMERSMQAEMIALAAGTPTMLDHDTAVATGATVGGEAVGWFQYQSIIPRIVREQPDFAEIWGAGV